MSKDPVVSTPFCLIIFFLSLQHEKYVQERFHHCIRMLFVGG